MDVGGLPGFGDILAADAYGVAEVGNNHRNHRLVLLYLVNPDVKTETESQIVECLFSAVLHLQL